MSKPVLIFGHQMSQPSRCVWWFCVNNEIPHEFKFIDFAKGEHKSDEYKKIHPFGKIPAIDDDGFVLYESHAILRYLSQKYKTADHWYPHDLKRRAIIDAYLDWHHGNIRASATPLFYNAFFLKKSPSEVAQFQKDTETALSCIDKIWLGENNKFIAGSHQPSIADLSAFSEVFQLTGMDFDFLAYPNITRWMDEMQKVEGFSRVFEVFFEFTGRSR